MDPSALVLLVLLVIGLTFNGREVIRRGLARVPALARNRRLPR
jgi:hypothetical protein